MSMSNADPGTALLAVAAIGGGAFTLVWPAKAQARIEAEYQRKLQDRLARGSDAYFEELRTIQAYPPRTGMMRRRVVGGIFVALGLSYLLIILFA